MSADQSSLVLRNLRQLHDAMVAVLSAAYRDKVNTVAAYDPFPDLDDQERQPLTTPAILLELQSIGEGEADGTDRQALRLDLTAHCILSLRTEQVQLELREMATDVLNRIRHERWGLAGAVQQPTALAAQAGEFAPGLAGYDSWQVTWEQTIYVGPGMWLPAPGTVRPVAIWLGQAPLIGTGHEADYDLIVEAPE